MTTASNNRFYVYYLIDPIDNMIFYVGKGFGNRLYHHENNVKKDKIPHGNKHLYYKIKQILNEGKCIIYKKIIENVDNETSFKIEISEIKKQREVNPKLCNIGNGGEGGDNFTNNPNKFSYIEKMRIIGKRIADKHLTGKHRSDETKRKLSLILRTPEWNRKNSENRKGKALGPRNYMSDPVKREIWIKKISENHTDISGIKNPFFGKHHNKETRDEWSRKRRKFFKVFYDGKEEIVEGGKILRQFVKNHKDKHGTNYNVPMLRYKNNSAGWKIELYESK